nr:MAG TPA: GABH ALL/GABH BLL coil heterodimer, DE NOVO.1A [Caudoviricetes sp.]
MESKVEMMLEEYTNLIRENERLKAMLHTCHRQLEGKAKDSVEVYTINDLTKEQCDEALKMDEKTLIYEYTYGRTFNDAIVDFPCFTNEEIKTVFVEAILKKIKGRMGDLKDKE